MGIFDFFKKHKNIENDNGFNEIYNDVSGFFRLEGYKKDGHRDGLWKSYGKNKTLVMEENYKGGIRHGESKTFGSRGISNEVNFINGKKEGVETDYLIYPNKKILVKFYVKGKKHGAQLCFWYGGTTLQSESNYNKGERDGIQKWYYKNGQLGTETNYIEGKLTFKKCWDENGNEIDEESFTGHSFGVE
jgi:antitoxin component YwqK of YwqJK toxin-antitoxin module